MIMHDYYKILSVNKTATFEEIKSAYHKLAKEYHPDKVSEDKKKDKEEEFALISKAYNILKDKEKRKEYDKLLADMKKKIKEGKAPQPDTDAVSAISSKTSKTELNEISDKAFKMGVSLFNSGQYVKSIEYFESAVKANKDNADVHMFLALAYAFSKKSVNKAVDYCKRAIELDPWNIMYKIHLGRIYKMAGIKSLAEQTFKEVLKWEPENKEAKLELQMLNGKSSARLFNFLNKFFQKKK